MASWLRSYVVPARVITNFNLSGDLMISWSCKPLYLDLSCAVCEQIRRSEAGLKNELLHVSGLRIAPHHRVWSPGFLSLAGAQCAVWVLPNMNCCWILVTFGSCGLVDTARLSCFCLLDALLRCWEGFLLDLMSAGGQFSGKTDRVFFFMGPPPGFFKD